jgi:DNA polymerase-3 subunit epsilon
MREIVLDTETTGLDPLRGDRLVEIGCVEMFNRMPTGQTFHRHINPEREMPAEAFAVHGLSSEFLRAKPLFAEVVDDFLEFIADAPLVIHNASFDVSFINAELDRIKRPPIVRERLVDTLLLARRKHPGVSNRLDDLCSRYAIDNSRRTKHGALLDAERSGAPVAVVDVPLLFETGSEKRVDAVVVVTTSPENQRTRILARGTMTKEALDALLARQMPDEEKRKRADFVVDTSHGLDPVRARIRDILDQAAKMPRRRP